MQREKLQKYKLPDGPGVYIFKAGKRILYIGKAASLRDRVRSYFSTDLIKGRGERIVGMVEKARSLLHKKTDSVLEALILEANLIKRHQPRYNVDEKDNKSFNYVMLTREDFPRVLIIRGRELFQNHGFRKPLHISGLRNPYIFGPYPHGGQLKEALRIIRKIFPFRDKCLPCSAARQGLAACKPCFNRQIGLCPGVCSGEVSKEEYTRTIRYIRKLFSGNFKELKRGLVHEMKTAAAVERFEDATQLRRQIDALEHIRDISLIKDEHRYSSGGSFRIEAYDVAHTAGNEVVGVMTVVSSNETQKNEYRKFKIRSVTNNDVAALSEMLERRFTHVEWQLPRIITVDGGKAHVRAAERVLQKAGISISVVGVVKNEFHKPERLIGDKRAIEAYEKDILLANNEAHRFAIGWHRTRQRKRML